LKKNREEKEKFGSWVEALWRAIVGREEDVSRFYNITGKRTS